MGPIDGAAPVLPLAAPHEPFDVRPPTKLEQTEAGAVFETMLGQAVSTANGRLKEAEALGEEFAAGRRDDIHGTMLSLAKADIELRLVGSVRNKVIDAFYELWRMQV